MPDAPGRGFLKITTLNALTSKVSRWTFAAIIAAAALYLVASIFVAPGVSQDAARAADSQNRLDLGRQQMKAGQFEPEAFKRQEKETDDYISKLRGRHWGLNRVYFEYVYFTARHDDDYRTALAQANGDGVSFNPIAIIGYGVMGFIVVCVVWGGAKMFIAFCEYNPKISVLPPQPPKPADTYGSAEWAEPIIAPPDAMTIFSGVFFGKSSAPGPFHLAPFERQQCGPVFSVPENHCLVIGRARTGKGTRVIIPTLLRQVTSSCICIDPKGELAAVTARARMNPFPGKDFHHTVHIINPWGELAPHFKKLGLSFATYNPLDILNANDPNAVSIAQDLAAAICPREKGGKDQFWSQSAASILTAVLLWLTDQPGETKTLGRAREIVTNMDFKKEFLPRIAASKAFGGSIAENAGPFVNMANETFSGVMGNLSQHTGFLSDPQVKAATATSTFNMLDLTRKTVTVYLVIPPYKMDVQRTWLRLLISAGMQTYKHHAGKGGNRCLFLIDEFPALGLLEEIPRDLATMCGYGVDFLLAIQGIDQLRAVYGDAADTILNNCAYKWFCNVNDLRGAEYLSKTLGNKTVATESKGQSENIGHGGGSQGSSTTHGFTGRPLLMPDEILNLGRDTAVLLSPGSKPNYLRPVDYWKLAEAFAPLRQFYPQMYWEPPMQWDENPLVPSAH